jgi:nucleoside-diphosphate-sugar epimerase
MKILITGATGFVGSAIIEKLIDKNESRYSIIAAARSRKTIEKKYSKSVKFCFLDLNKVSELDEALKGVEIVIHTAARVHKLREKSHKFRDDYMKINSEATVKLAKLSAQAGVKKFIFLSSIKVNGPYTKRGNPFSNDSIDMPSDAYSLSKQKAEIGLKKVLKGSNTEYIIIRTPLIYGPEVKGNFATLVKLTTARVPLPFASINFNKRSLIGIDNLLSFLIECMFNKRAVNRTFLVSDGDDLSTAELFTKLAIAMKIPTNIFKFPVPVLLCFIRFLGLRGIYERLFSSLEVDISETCRDLDWRPPYTVDECMSEIRRKT